MARRSVSTVRVLCATLLLCSPAWCGTPQKSADKTKHIPKTVWNFDGGIFLETDGSFNENTCFRLAGRVVSEHFFDNLKRIDDDDGTRYIRGKETITDFPEEVSLLIVIHDWPCPGQLKADVKDQHREYLTRDMMKQLKLSLFWKHGVELRPAENIKVSYSAVKPVEPYAKELTQELPERFEWAYELAIPSAGVPLSDSLVLVLKLPDGRVAARVAARM
jgi:hypothetical protein